MISSADCSTWLTIFPTITVAVVAVNLLSIILFLKNSNLRTRAMYLLINLTVADMFFGGMATFGIVVHFFHYAGLRIYNNYSPKWRWLVVNIYRTAKQ